MTVAAVDRLVHRATIFELNVDSYRRRSALRQQRQRRAAASTEPAPSDPPAGGSGTPLRNGEQ